MRELPHIPPLFSRSLRVPALFYVSGKTVKPMILVRSAVRVRLPWNVYVPGYAVPVARHGIIMGVCRPEIHVEERTVVLDCRGEPDESILRPVIRAAILAGWELKARTRRLYTFEEMEDLAWRIAEQYVNSPDRFPHVIPYYSWSVPGSTVHYNIGAHMYASSILRVSPARIFKLKTDLPERLGDPTRNRLKTAVEYMCTRGDKVACHASKAVNLPVWRIVMAREKEGGRRVFRYQSQSST